MTTSTSSTPVVTLKEAGVRLQIVHAKFQSHEISSLEHSRLREACLSDGLAALAAHYGVALQMPLQINSLGEFSVVVERPNPGAKATGYGDLAAVLNRHHPRTGVQPHAATLEPESCWCYMNHFEVEKMILEQAQVLS